MKVKFTAILILFFFNLQAKQYYVSSNGSDTNLGISKNSPWKTISKVNSIMNTFLPGDSILFNAGDTFNGGLLISVSGSTSNPIYFGKYGTGNNPIFKGTVPILSSSWENVSSNIWRAYFNNNSTNRVTGLFINGVKQSIGRYPNATPGGNLNGFGKISKVTDSSFVDSMFLTDFPFIGAEFVSKSDSWRVFQSKISKVNGNIISLTYNKGANILPVVNNWGYIVRNHFKTLDLYGEWYFNEITDSIYLYVINSPSNLLVEATNIDNLIYAKNKNNIIIEGIEFNRSQAEACKLENCNNISFIACNFTYNSNTALESNNSHDLLISNCTFSWNSGRHILLNKSQGIFSNNLLENNALNFGDIEMNNDYTSNPIAFNVNMLNNSVIKNNIVKKCGYSGIGGYSQTNLVIKENVVDSFNLVFDDGGGIYINSINSNVLINNNFISNGFGANLGTNRINSWVTNGIYLDDGCQNVTVKANTIYGIPSKGIFLQKDAINNTILNNLVWSDSLGLSGSAFHSSDYIDNINNYNNIAEGNVFLSSSYYDGSVYSATSVVNKCNTNKNYYIKPFSDQANNFPIARKYTPKEWYAITGNDLNSKSSPITLPRFTISSYQSNLISNGNFSSGINGWSIGKEGNGNGALNWQSSDGGVLKLSYTSLSQSYPAWLSAKTNVNIDSGQKYLLKFKYKGANAKVPVSVSLWYLRSNISNGIITDTIWKQASVILEANYTGPAQLSIQAKESAMGSLYLDNIELIPVTATYTNINDFVKLYTNKSVKYSYVTLPSLDAGMYYLDKDGYLINPGNFTLAPYTSRFIFISSIKPTISKPFRSSVLFR